MKVSVITSNLEPQGIFISAIQALCTQDFPQDQYEVFVPDLGTLCPEEHTILRDLARRYPRLRVIIIPGKNRSQMINEAARRARGEILLFIETHCIPPHDWIARYVRLFQTKNIDAALGSITPMPSRAWSARIESGMLDNARDTMKRLGVYKSFFDFHNSAVTRKCFWELGGFDDNLPMMMEFEFGVRLYEAGKRLHAFDECTIWHRTDATLKNYDRIIHGQGKDRTRMLLRHGPSYMNKYFPNPAFVRALPLLKAFRIPAYILAKILMYCAAAGFHITTKLNISQRLADFWFRAFAKNSLRRGMLIGLKS